TLACSAALSAALSTTPSLDPCMTVKCVAGKVCETTREGTAQCVEELIMAPGLEPNPADPVTLGACAATSCPIGAVCVEDDGVSVAPSTPSSITCENTECVRGFICEMKDGKPTCRAGGRVTCDGFDCDIGHHSSIRPLAASPMSLVTCENIDCKSGMVCEIKNGQPTCVNKVIPLITCENTDCVIGMVCEMKEGKPTCFNSRSVTCKTVKCAGNHHCVINPGGAPECIPRLTCANMRCAGECQDTPRGPVCGPRLSPGI
ncbi:hypothetical protein PENTCL1PPCAC_30179, partial [Pristionchus entomophagus]